MASNRQYYITEAEVSRLLETSGLPEEFQRLFARDYVALKGDAVSIDSRLDDVSSESTQNSTDITETNETVATLRSDYDSHASNNEAHGSTGDIVGTGDYCTDLIGGTVLLASAVVDASTSIVSAVLSPNAAGLTYLQADASTWVAMLNEHKAQINQLTIDLNAAINIINLMLASDRTAKQRAP